MKNKLLIFSCTALITLLSTNQVNPNLCLASDNTVSYQNNAYQMHEVQSQTKNLLLSESIYNVTQTRFQLKNSIRIKNGAKNIFSLFISFDEEDTRTIAYGGYIRFYIIDDNGNDLACIDKSFSSEQELDDLGPYSLYCNENYIVLTFDTSSFPDYFTFCGEEYASNNKSFFIDSPDPLTVRAFSLETNHISYDDRLIGYPKPKYGIAPNSNGVYCNGSTYNIDIDYDNRLTVNDITNNITAYDYDDNREVDKSVTDDTYSKALQENKLGTYSFKVNAQDSSNNKSQLTVNATIKDLTAPVIYGENDLSISYKELSETDTISLKNYYEVVDNYDANINLDTDIIQLTRWDKTNVTLKAIDSSSNISKKDVSIYVYDDIKPLIIGPSSLEFYQFEIKDDAELLKNFTYDDEDGSGVKEYGIKKALGKCDYGKTGSYPITIYCIDKFNNESTYQTTIKIKDGIGPVFFINEVSLSLTTSSLKTANEIISLAQDQKIIESENYIECKFIDNEYQENYRNEGSYKTRIVCYKKDGTKDYFMFKINIQKEYERNLFKRIFNSIVDFFNRFTSFFKYIWNAFTK